MNQPAASREPLGDMPGRTALLPRGAQVALGQLVLAAIGAYVSIEAHSLGLWTALGPGPGLLPLILGLALVGLTAVWFAQVLLARRRTLTETETVAEDEAPSGPQLDRTYVLGVVGGLIVLASVMDLLGFQLSMALFLFAELKWLGRQKWWLSAAVALVGSVGTFALFDRVLTVQLPLSSLPLLSGLGF